VGGVSGRPTRERKGAILWRARRRCGGRHPAHRVRSPFAGWPRNVGLGRSVHRSSRSLPRRAGAPATNGAPRTSRRGTSSACVIKRMHPPRGQCAVVVRGHVLRSVLGPVLVNRHWTSKAQVDEGDAVFGVSRSGKLAQARGTGTGALSIGPSAARRASPLPQGRPCVTRQKRKEIAVSVPARFESSGRSARTSQCSCRNREAALVSNKLSRSAPKRATARVNGGLARSGRRRQNAGDRVERRDVASRTHAT